MRIKAEINFYVINTGNEYKICDKIRKGLTTLLEENIKSLVDCESEDPLYNISVVPIKD